MGVKVKICGLTEPQQAAEVADAGADAVGLVFAPSPRRVDPDRAADIVAALPAGVLAVGVFVDFPAGDINAIAERVGLSIAQLHGEEPPAIVSDLAIPCWKAFGVRSGQYILDLHEWLVCLDSPGEQSLRGVMFDAWSPAMAGGSGETFNWHLLDEARSRGELEGFGELILAGGLQVANVAEAIRVVQPDWVDVSSGVEQAKGIKDPHKVRDFIAAVRQADPQG
jgi:phosphoribosylanthranilate isomerase